MAELRAEEIRGILLRAEEIEREAALGGQTQDALVAAAEEAGLSRESVVRALQERMSARTTFGVGDWVYARSADRRYYPATVSQVHERGYDVHFASGGEATVPADAVRIVELLPGAKVEVPWPHWGWYNCSIVAYDARTKMVKVSDGMSEQQFSLVQTRQRPDLDDRERQIRLWATYALFALGGTAFGMVLMRILAG